MKMESIASLPVICISTIFLFSIAYSQPAGPTYYQSPAKPSPAHHSAGSDKDARITAYSFDFNPEDSSFQYGFETDNGLSQQARGYIKPENIQVIEGSYVTIDSEGKPSVVTYVADENGYNPQGDSIPTPSPLIAKVVAYQKSLPPVPESPTYPQSAYYPQSPTYSQRPTAYTQPPSPPTQYQYYTKKPQYYPQ